MDNDEPIYKEILSFHASKERNMFVAERILSKVVEEYGIHSVSTNDGDGCTWYPQQACKFLKLKHHLHSSFVYKNEKSIIERIIQQYIKDRIERFDD